MKKFLCFIPVNANLCCPWLVKRREATKSRSRKLQVLVSNRTLSTCISPISDMELTEAVSNILNQKKLQRNFKIFQDLHENIIYFIYKIYFNKIRWVGESLFLPARVHTRNRRLHAWPSQRRLRCKGSKWRFLWKHRCFRRRKWRCPQNCICTKGNILYVDVLYMCVCILYIYYV